MDCIFCGQNSDSAVGVEHIISESLGNKNYTLQKGDVCDDCNGRFSGFEQTALAASIIAMERARHAIPSKKNKPSKGKVRVGNILMDVDGDTEFRPGIINVKTKEDLPVNHVNPEKGEFKITISGPNEGESVAIAKLLLKMGIEALYQTQGEVYDEFNFEEAKTYVLGKSNNNWPFIMPMRHTNHFINILKEEYKINQELERYRLRIGYMETVNEDVLFKFSIANIDFIINLVNRNTDWIGLYLSTKAVNGVIYPPSLEKRFRRKFNLPDDN